MTAAMSPSVGAEPRYLTVPLAQLHESDTNYRKHHDDAAHAELVASVREKGILTPLLVRGHPTRLGWEVAAGHRRLRAARAAGLTEAPVIVRAMDDREFAEVMLTENLQRRDPDPLDEADGYQALIDRLGYDVPTLAARFGKGETYIRQRLQLQRCGANTRRALQLDRIELGHAVLLARVDEAEQDRLLRTVLSVTDVAEAASTDGRGEAEADDDDEDGSYDDDTWDEDEQHSIREVPTDTRRTGVSVARLRKVMATRFLPLTVPWALDDATLVPSAGACTSCPKRSGAAPELFEEFGTGDDRCGDQACFADKKAAWLEARVTACQSQAPALVAISTVAYGKPKLKTIASLPVLQVGVGYRVAEKKDKRRTPAIIVDEAGLSLEEFGELGQLTEVVLLDPAKEKAKKKQKQIEVPRTLRGNAYDMDWSARNKRKERARERFVVGATAVVQAMLQIMHVSVWPGASPVQRVALSMIMRGEPFHVAIDIVQRACDYTWKSDEIGPLLADEAFRVDSMTLHVASEVMLLTEWGPVEDDAWDQITIDEATQTYPLPEQFITLAARYMVDAPAVFAAALQDLDREAKA